MTDSVRPTIPLTTVESAPSIVKPLNKPRNREIDVLKGVLVLGMILSHVISLIGSQTASMGHIDVLLNLVSFSGFLFCFGYTTTMSYLKSPERLRTRITKTIIRLVIAFYISSVSYELLVNTGDKLDAALQTTLQILVLSKLGNYSEFLINFPLTLLIGVLLAKPIGAVVNSKTAFIVVLVILLATTHLPVEQIQQAQLGLFIGDSPAVSYAFPVLQYFPLYLIGVYFAYHQPRRLLLTGVLSLLGSAMFVVYVTVHPDLPQRFPPSLLWILPSIAFTLLWYCVSYLLSWWPLAVRVLAPIGSNSLIYLLLSNLIIFGLKIRMTDIPISPVASVLITVTITVIVRFITTLNVQPIYETRT